MNIAIRTDRNISKTDILELYVANKWSSAEKPDILYKALLGSHSLITAWKGDQLVGLANAISDGHLVVYYPHMLVHPTYHGNGVGKRLFDVLQETYSGFHMQMLTADGKAIQFYEKMGFTRAGKTEPMWIYQGDEH